MKLRSRKREDEPTANQAKKRRTDDEEAANQVAIAAAENRIVSDYLEPNFAAIELRYEDGQLKVQDYSKSNGNNFKELAQNLTICGSEGVDDEGLHSIGQHCKSLKQIVFANSLLNATKIKHIKAVLSKIETVKFDNVNFEGEFDTDFLQFCPKLKHLCIVECQREITFLAARRTIFLFIGVNNNWLDRRYPALKHLEYYDKCHRPFRYIRMLAEFLKRNTNVKKLLINCFTLKRLADNYFDMHKSTIRLKDLIIDSPSKELTKPDDQRLTEIYERGFYKRLHLGQEIFHQQEIDRISVLKRLETLCLYGNSTANGLNLNSLINIKELHIFNVDDSFDSESTAKSLVSLERLHFGYVRPEQVEPFIEFAAQLKVIKINFLYVMDETISSLNKKREKLVGAQKLTIYLDDRSFVDMKCRNESIDFNMIEVKRAASYDEQTFFSFSAE